VEVTAVDPAAPAEPPPSVDANSRLTSEAGVVLFVLLAVQGVTILRIHRMVVLHTIVGFVLLGPLVVKLGSTGWRFVRYYSGDADFRRAGPPRPLLRVLAPVMVLLTLAVFATGIALLAVSPNQRSPLVPLHKASFVLWFVVTTIHVLAYVRRAFARAALDVVGRGPSVVVASRRLRYALVIATVVCSTMLGLVGTSWVQPWAHWFASAGGDR
jgi:hypothetical protein